QCIPHILLLLRCFHRRQQFPVLLLAEPSAIRIDDGEICAFLAGPDDASDRTDVANDKAGPAGFRLEACIMDVSGLPTRAEPSVSDNGMTVKEAIDGSELDVVTARTLGRARLRRSFARGRGCRRVVLGAGCHQTPPYYQHDEQDSCGQGGRRTNCADHEFSPSSFPNSIINMRVRYNPAFPIVVALDKRLFPCSFRPAKARG